MGEKVRSKQGKEELMKEEETWGLPVGEEGSGRERRGLEGNGRQIQRKTGIRHNGRGVRHIM